MQGKTRRHCHSFSLWVSQCFDYIPNVDQIDEIGAFLPTGDTLGTRCMNILSLSYRVAWVRLSAIACLHDSKSVVFGSLKMKD